MVVGSYRRGFDDLNTSCLDEGSLCRMSNFRNHSCRLPLAFPCTITSKMLSCHMSNLRKSPCHVFYIFTHVDKAELSHMSFFCNTYVAASDLRVQCRQWLAGNSGSAKNGLSYLLLHRGHMATRYIFTFSYLFIFHTTSSITYHAVCSKVVAYTTISIISNMSLSIMYSVV